jgi:enterochelin esterase family protein
VTRHRFESAALGNGRDVFLYRSPGYDPKDPRTILLVLFDADHYLTKAPTPRILDNMVADGVLPPLAAVLVANPDAEARSRELPGNPAFAAMMARDLVPWAARDLGLTLDPARTVLAGSSYGGLASATIALAYPEVFGNVLSMSGSFWWHPPGTPEDRSVFVADRVIGMETKPVRFFMSAGLFEGARPGALGAILETNRHVRDVLRAKGYTVRYREYAAGHDYLAWRGILSDGLLALFGS